MKVQLVLAALFATGYACAATAPPRGIDAARDNQPGDKLSQSLPKNLATFVECFSTDRDIAGVPPEVVERFLVGDPKVDDLLEYIAPNEVLGINGPVTLKPSAGGRGGLPTRGALLISGTEVTLDDGETIPFGGVVAIDQVVQRGVVINGGDTDIVVLGAETEVILQPGNLLIIRCANSCSVDGCGSGGTFACCWWPGGCAKCKCVTAEPAGGCDSGGPHSTGCSVTDTDIIIGP